MASLEIRKASAADYALVTALVPEMHSGDPAPSAERFATRMLEGTRVAVVDGVDAGYIYLQFLEGVTYVRHLVVASGYRGRGVGRALMQAARAEAVSRECLSWRLNVKPGNVAAVALYHSVGMRQRHESIALGFAWGLEQALGHAQRELVLTRPEPIACAALEAHFALPQGQLQSLSGAPAVKVRAVTTQAAAPLQVGVAAFDTNFPGCFPFCLDDVGDVGDVLRMLRPLATQPEMGVVIEANAALASALIAVGARVKLRFVHLVGALEP